MLVVSSTTVRNLESGHENISNYILAFLLPIKQFYLNGELNEKDNTRNL